MKRTILFLLAVTTAVSSLFGQITKNPFSKLSYKKQVMYTSSKGEFEEFHGNPDVVEIGTVYFNTKTNKVVGYLNEEKEKAEVASATSAMSVDPLCEKYYWISPYAFCLNNPVRFIDPDGKQVFIGLNTPLLGISDPILMTNKPVITETITRVGRTTTEISSTGGRGINIERVNAGRHAETEQLQKLGMEKNTESFTRVDPKTGKESTTIPDGFKNGQTTEIKNLGKGQNNL